MPIEVKAHEAVWLREMERRMIAGLPIDAKDMMVALRDALPRGFQRTDVNPRLTHGFDPTLEGIDAIGDSGHFLPDVERAILHIRERLVQNPALNQVIAKELSEALSLSPARAERVLSLIASIGAFSAGASPSPHGVTSISFGRNDILAEYLGFQSISDLLSRRAAEQKVPSSPTPTPPNREVSGRFAKNTAFILMSMDPQDDSLIDVCNTIKRACAEFGVIAIRVDDIEHQDRITDQILEGIASAEFIIADLTGERPNVHYEIGYAHALNKRPILIRKLGTSLHFDLSVHNAPEYRNNTELRSLLLKRLEAMLGRSPKSGA
jgi:hypothetical protein